MKQKTNKCFSKCTAFKVKFTERKFWHLQSRKALLWNLLYYLPAYLWWPMTPILWICVWQNCKQREPAQYNPQGQSFATLADNSCPLLVHAKNLIHTLLPLTPMWKKTRYHLLHQTQSDYNWFPQVLRTNPFSYGLPTSESPPMPFSPQQASL